MFTGLSDRDKKIILILLTAMVIFLPYFFYIKDQRIATDGIKNENVALNERLEYLRSLDAQRQDIIDETVSYNAARDKIIESFPADIKPENYTMFLLETEYSSAEIDKASGEAEWVNPILFDSLTYGLNEETSISNEEADTGFVGLTNESVVTYSCYYPGFKYLLDYLKEYKDPMAYRGFTAKFDEQTGVISGEIVLDQYAISGGDRTLPKVNIRPDLDSIKLRGNEEVGVFGPIEITKDNLYLFEDEMGERREAPVEEAPAEEAPAEE